MNAILQPLARTGAAMRPAAEVPMHVLASPPSRAGRRLPLAATVLVLGFLAAACPACDAASDTGGSDATTADGDDPSFGSVTLPAWFSLGTTLSPFPAIFTQGDLGDTVAESISWAMQYVQQKQLLAAKSSAKAIVPSRLFLYYNARFLEGSVRQDAGATLSDGLRAAAQWGACPETGTPPGVWPYVVAKFAQSPPLACYAAAPAVSLLDPISTAVVANNTTAIKTALFGGSPIIVGIPVYPSFLSTAVSSTGTVPMPGWAETMVGGHSLVLVGYDDSTQRYTAANAWGTSWGVKGYCTLPYAYVTNYGFDVYRVGRVGTNPKPTAPPAGP